MLNKYLNENYNNLKDVALNIAGSKEYEELLHFVIMELYKCDKKKLKEIIKKKQMTFYTVRIMINQLNKRGYLAKVTNGWDNTIKEIDKYLEL